MDDELKHFLSEAPHTVADLARLTGRSPSGIRLILNKNETLLTKATNSSGVNVFSLKSDQSGPASLPESTPEDPNGGQGAPSTPLPTPAPVEPVETPPAPPPADEPKDAAPKVETRGRKAVFAGKKIYPSDKLLKPSTVGAAPFYINPRRSTSHGYKSMKIVLEEPGLTTEAFVERGGRLADLRWDHKNGNVRIDG